MEEVAAAIIEVEEVAKSGDRAVEALGRIFMRVIHRTCLMIEGKCENHQLTEEMKASTDALCIEICSLLLNARSPYFLKKSSNNAQQPLTYRSLKSKIQAVGYYILETNDAALILTLNYDIVDPPKFEYNRAAALLDDLEGINLKEKALFICSYEQFTDSVAIVECSEPFTLDFKFISQKIVEDNIRIIL